MLAKRYRWLRALAGFLAGGMAVGLLLPDPNSLGAAVFTASFAGLVLALLGGGWEGLLARTAAIVVGWWAVAALLYHGQWALLGIVAQGVPATVAFSVGWLLSALGNRRRPASGGGR